MSERGARADERRVSSRPLAPDFAAWRTRLLSGVREEERRFLQTVGEHREEAARVGRMVRDIMRGLHELHGVERAVTVFGSARFAPRSAYYRMTLETGELLARAGYTAITAKLRTLVDDVLVGEGAVARDELSFAKVTDSPAEALRFIEATLATRGISARTGAGLPHDDT